jgi:hypothetical protein
MWDSCPRSRTSQAGANEFQRLTDHCTPTLPGRIPLYSGRWFRRFSDCRTDPAEPNLAAILDLFGRDLNRTKARTNAVEPDLTEVYNIGRGLMGRRITGLQAEFALTLGHYRLRSWVGRLPRPRKTARPRRPSTVKTTGDRSSKCRPRF